MPRYYDSAVLIIFRYRLMFIALPRLCCLLRDAVTPCHTMPAPPCHAADCFATACYAMPLTLRHADIYAIVTTYHDADMLRLRAPLR